MSRESREEPITQARLRALCDAAYYQACAIKTGRPTAKKKKAFAQALDNIGAFVATWRRK